MASNSHDAYHYGRNIRRELLQWQKQGSNIERIAKLPIAIVGVFVIGTAAGISASMHNFLRATADITKPKS